MVHIPIFGIEFPEPRVLEIIPDVIVTFIKICSRLVDAVTDAVYPLDDDEMKAVVTMQRNSIPREFDRVIARQMQGKIKNNEQLSSELEEASYDYYRRLLRTSVAGATDEGHDEFMSKQLFGLPLQPSAVVAKQYAMQHPEVFQDTDDALMGIVEAAVDGQGSAWVKERGMELQQHMRQLHQHADSRCSALDEQQQELQKLHHNARTAMAQATRSTANAGLGIALGLLVLKGVGLGLSRIMKAIRKGKKQAAGGNRPSGPVSRQPRNSSASGTPVQPPPPAATARTQRGQSLTTQASRQAAPAAASSSSTQLRSSQQPAQQASAAPTQASAEQQQQQQAAQSAPAARRARPASRTR